MTICLTVERKRYVFIFEYKTVMKHLSLTCKIVQILDDTVCISYCTNTLGKGMHPIILPLALGK